MAFLYLKRKKTIKHNFELFLLILLKSLIISMRIGHVIWLGNDISFSKTPLYFYYITKKILSFKIITNY